MNRLVAHLGRGLALLLAAIGLTAAWQAWRTMPMGAPGDPGPGVLPLLLGLAVGGLAIAAALSRAWPRPEPMAGGPVAVAVAAVLGWAITLPYLGFAVTTAAAVFLLGRAIGPAPIGRLLAFAVLVSGGASLLFRHLLKMPLPRGPWGW